MTDLIYNGQQINRRDSDGYLSGTSMCQANGKLIADWMRTNEYIRYTERLSESMGIPIDRLVTSNPGQPSRGGGTWIHPKLAIKLARWISVDFELWCDEHIETLMETGSTTLAEPQPEISEWEMMSTICQKSAKLEGKVNVLKDEITNQSIQHISDSHSEIKLSPKIDIDLNKSERILTTKIIKIVKELIEINRFTQKQFADFYTQNTGVKITYGAVQSWLRGTPPLWRNVAGLARLAGLSLDELAGTKESPQSNTNTSNYFSTLVATSRLSLKEKLRLLTVLSEQIQTEILD
jgi:hypothetical protein